VAAAGPAAPADPEGGWLPALLPAEARRYRVLDPALRRTLADAELVDSGAEVEIGPARSLGDAPLAIVPIGARSADPRSRAGAAAGRTLVSFRARALAAAAAARLRRRGYVAEVVLWDLNRPWRRASPGIVARLPRRALVVGRRQVRAAPTILDAVLADAGTEPSSVDVREAFLVVTGSGEIIRIAVGSARALLDAEQQSLERLRVPAPLRPLVPEVVGSGRVGVAAWLAERRLPGSPAESAPPEAVDFLVDLFSAAAGADVPALEDARTLGVHAPAEAEALQAVAGRVDRLLSGLPRGFAHGDFWSGNLLVEAGRLSGVIDWDAAGPGRPPLIDLLHLRLIDARRPAGHAWGRAVVAELLPWARRGGDDSSAGYCRRLGLQLDPETLRALVAGYWLQRLAYQVGCFADRADRRRWLEGNLAVPLRAFAEALQ
jgi:hypothetical protein